MGKRKKQTRAEARPLTTELAAKLADAWQKYKWLFHVVPHGTEKQLAALLELCAFEDWAKRKAGVERFTYQDGLRHAAEFAGEWDKQISGTRFRFEDIILCKFNLLPKKRMRRKKP